MAYQNVSGVPKYFKYAECEADQVLVEGTYMREFEGKFGPQHEFADADGQRTVLNSAGHLNYLLEERVFVGDWVRVTYLGKEALEAGTFAGKEAHKFDVDVDPDKVNKDIAGKASAGGTEVEGESVVSGNEVI